MVIGEANDRTTKGWCRCRERLAMKAAGSGSVWLCVASVCDRFALAVDRSPRWLVGLRETAGKREKRRGERTNRNPDRDNHGWPGRRAPTRKSAPSGVLVTGVNASARLLFPPGAVEKMPGRAPGRPLEAQARQELDSLDRPTGVAAVRPDAADTFKAFA